MKQIVTCLTLLLMGTSALAANEVTYRGEIRKLVEEKCAGCHGKDAAPELGDFKENKQQWLAKGQGMRMDTYSHLVGYVGWPDTGALMRRLDDGSGSSDKKGGNMYQHLGSTEDERQKNLNLFKGWVGGWSLKRWNEISKDELSAIRVKY